jgi:hypothetical protein
LFRSCDRDIGSCQHKSLICAVKKRKKEAWVF